MVLIQCQTNTERFTDALAAIVFVGVTTSVIYLCIAIVTACISAALKVMGMPYIIMDINPTKWKIIRPDADQKHDVEDRHVYGKYHHKYNDNERVYLARKDEHGDVYVFEDDKSEWFKLSPKQYAGFKPDKEFTV